MKKHYTITWNAKKRCFLANVREPNGSGWKKKWIPKGLFTETQSLQAESWLISWLSDYSKTNIAPANPQVIAKKTLALYLPRWLELRRRAVGTSINTYGTYLRAVNCHILDHPKHKHLSIQNLSFPELCQVTVLREWIQSLTGAVSSRLSVIGTLSVFFNDAVAEGWLDEDFVNPMQKRAVASMVRELKELRRKTSEVHVLPWPSVEALINKHHNRIILRRRVRYLLAVSTGLRASEIQGLVWSDFHFVADVPYLTVSRQLLKPGAKPWKVYEKELAKGKDKRTIMAGDNAVVSEPKTRSSGNSVPLHPSTVEALKALYASSSWKQPEDPVFTENGRFYTTRAKVLRKDLKRLKFKTDNVTFHCLRRTFASKLASLGVDDGTIDRLLRHSSKTVARVHYIQDDLAPLYAAVRRLPVTFAALGSSATKTTKTTYLNSATYLGVSECSQTPNTCISAGYCASNMVARSLRTCSACSPRKNYSTISDGCETR